MTLPDGTYQCRYCNQPNAVENMKSRFKCRACFRIANAAWAKANPDKMRAARRQYENRNPEIVKKNKRNWRKANPNLYTRYGREYQRAARRKVIDHYGAVCVCCGETEYKFLSFDHIIPIKSKRPRGEQTVREIIREGYPDTFQVLCYNCNMAKGFWGECPHLDT